MKAPIRAVLLASMVTLLVVGPVSADAPTTTHVSYTDCFTVEGLTFCSQAETDIRTKEQQSGTTTLKMDVWSLITTTDAAGNVLASSEITSREKDTVVVVSGGPVFVDQNVRRTDEVMDGGSITCSRYRILVKNGIERINEVTTTPGAC